MYYFVCQHDTAACLPPATEPVATVDATGFSVYAIDPLLHLITKNYRVFGSPDINVAATFDFATTPSIDIAVEFFLACVDRPFQPLTASAVSEMVTTAHDGLQVVKVIDKLALLNDAASCGVQEFEVTYIGVT